MCVLTRAASGHLCISLVIGVNPFESLTFMLSRQLLKNSNSRSNLLQSNLFRLGFTV